MQVNKLVSELPRLPGGRLFVAALVLSIGGSVPLPAQESHQSSQQAAQSGSTPAAGQPSEQEHPAQGQAQHWQTPDPRPQYLDLRYDEDWSRLPQSKTPPDFFDPIKYIPFKRDGWYTSFGGELRTRYDNWNDANFGYAPAEFLNSNLQRYLFHNDTHLGRHFRVFTQVQSSLEFGKKGGPWYTDKDTFEVHQAFVDIGAGASSGAKNYVTLRVGRQEVALSTNHFVSTGDFFNSRRAFDGARLMVGRGSWTYLFEATKPVEINFGAFDDKPEHARTSWAAGFIAPNPLTRGGQTAGFYIGLDSKSQMWNRGIGRDERHTIGGRILGMRKGWDYTYEVLAQVGTFTSFLPVARPVAIRAWGFTSDNGYTNQRSRFYPRLGARFNVTSGDSGRGALGTFHPLFPDTAYSGRMGMIGPSNIIDVTPTGRFALSRRVFFIPEWSFFWRQNTNDGVYGVLNYLAKPGNYSRARFVGHQMALASHIIIDRHLSYTMAYNYLWAGEFIKQTPPGKNSALFVAWFTYRF